MDTLRFFRDLAKADLRRVRRSPDYDGSGLQRAQHEVAQRVGFASWDALRQAPETERDIAAVMELEPWLCVNGFGAGFFGRMSPAERRNQFAQWRSELRAAGDRVGHVRGWLKANIAPRQTVNPAAGSYGVKNTAERHLGVYVANGELIAAAILAGYPYRRETGTSPNAVFGMSSRSLTLLRR